MFIVAGLGNPGRKYDESRHNIGFSVIDELCSRLNVSMDFEKHKALCGNAVYEGTKLLLAKPLTFMNLSGESVGELVRYYKIDVPTQLLIISDDVDMDFGKLRIRKSGSAGGHNGIKNIIAHLGTQEFMRLKIGVGAKPPAWDLADWVLGRFSEEDTARLREIREEAAQAVLSVIKDGPDRAMNMFN